MKMDYYELLGVSRDCDEKTLKLAFRKLAMKYHPDRNPGCKESERKFKEIGEAYDVLKDAQKRAAYDRYGHSAFANGGMGAGNPFQGFGSGIFAETFEDIFGQMMNGGRRKKADGRERGADLSYNLEITLEEAYQGKTVEIKVASAVSCSLCSGSGCKAGTKPKTCSSCNGTGRVQMTQGFFAIERSCMHCQGRGEIIADPCSKCSGNGRVEEERTLSINVPAGIEDGTRIRLAGEGEAGRYGGKAGDLYVFVSVSMHEFFQRDGADLYCRVPIYMTTAALGGEFAITTLDGIKTCIKVPEATQNGKQFRLKGKGMPILRQQSKGDLYVQVSVETPQNLTKKQKELLEAFAKETNQEQHSPQSHGFFSKMKDFFEYISGT